MTTDSSACNFSNDPRLTQICQNLPDYVIQKQTQFSEDKEEFNKLLKVLFERKNNK